MVNKLTNTVKPLDEVDKINEIIDALDDKQDTLVSGSNIKTINNNSILGSGNLTLNGLPSQTGNANKFLTTDGTDASWAAVPTRNIGEIVASTIPLTDAGLHLLDGALIQGDGIYSAFVTAMAALSETNPELFCSEANWQASVTQYGVCGKFVYDSTNNTVRLPKITGIVEGTTDATALGDLVEAGLPNITGSVGQGYQSNTINGGFHNYSNKGFGTGSLYLDGTTNGNTCTWQEYGDAGLLKIDASRSSSIYGNSSTVQPQTIKAFYYIVIATSTKTDVQVNIDEIATDLNGKADIDLTNTTPAISFATAMNNAGIRTVVETYINGTSWYRVYSDGWCEQGGIINSVSQDSYTSATVSLLKSYKNTNYSVLLTQWDNGQTLGLDGATNGQAVHSKGVNNFVIATYSWTYGRMWQACGYIR